MQATKQITVGQNEAEQPRAFNWYGLVFFRAAGASLGFGASPSS